MNKITPQEDRLFFLENKEYKSFKNYLTHKERYSPSFTEMVKS